MTERTDIGYIEVSKRDDFFEIWRQTDVSQSMPGIPAASGSSGGKAPLSLEPGAGATAATPRLKQDSTYNGKNETMHPPNKKLKTDKQSPGKGGGARGGVGGAGSGGAGSVTEANIPKAWLLKATKTKRSYHEVVSTATSLKGTIKSNPTWSWANNVENLNGLESAMRNLEAKISPFIQSFLGTDIQHLKACLVADAFNLEVQKVPSELDDKLKALTVEINKLNALHSVHRSYGPGKA
jgi:hypothetical protein